MLMQDIWVRSQEEDFINIDLVYNIKINLFRLK